MKHHYNMLCLQKGENARCCGSQPSRLGAAMTKHARRLPVVLAVYGISKCAFLIRNDTNYIHCRQNLKTPILANTKTSTLTEI